MSHTPGPWRARKRKFEPYEVTNDNGVAHAHVYRYTDGAELPDEANARLVAAAPELLTALRDLLDVIATDELIPESVSYMRQARAAIRKAEGQSA